jgi:hypothetical protein
MRTYGNTWGVFDKDDVNVQSQLVLANLRKGDKLKIGSIEYEVTVQTKKTLRLKSDKKCYSFKIWMLEEFGKWCCNAGKGYDPADKILSDIQGDLILDSINSNNPLHELTDSGKILLRDPIYEFSIGMNTWKKAMDRILSVIKWHSLENDFKDIVIDSKFITEAKHIFSLPFVKEEIIRYTKGFKGEAKESKEAFLILGKYMKGEDITEEEKNFFKDQMIDILKGIGVILPIQLIPLPFVSTILLIVMDYTLKSMGIKILPSSFYEEEKKDEKL